MKDKRKAYQDEVAARGRSPDFGTAEFNLSFGHPKLPERPKDDLSSEAIDRWIFQKEDWMD
jgi:hypothetical protein